MQSPEATGDYRCPACGNTKDFVAYDDRGYAGDDPDEHRDNCRIHNGDTVCDCDVTLVQPVTHLGNGELDYGLFEGGGPGAVIGQYTRIRCAACDAYLYKQAER